MDTSPMASQDSLRRADTVSVAPVISPEVSVVMPCLNEADTLATCIDKARRRLREHGIAGEVIVADNGSTDGSQAIARAPRARASCVSRRAGTATR